MARIECLCFAGAGHVCPMASLGMELRQRGRSVVLFQRADFRERIESAGLEYEDFGEAQMPPGSLRHELEASSSPGGYAAFERAQGTRKRQTTALYHEVPEKARRHGVELSLIGQVCDAGSAMAQATGLLCQPSSRLAP